MAQVNDLLVLGKANFLNEITSSQLLRAFGGIALDDSTEQSTALEYVLGIKAFASGGNVMWSNVNNFANVIRLNASGNWGINISGLAAKTTMLATARTIFGHSFDGTANVAGQPLVYGSYNSTAGSRYSTGGIQIRENGLVGSAQSDIAYAPAIGFHWGGRIAASLLFHSDGIFYFRKQNFTDRATIDANVNGSLNGNATTATVAGKISDITTNDLASSSATKRRIWFCYDNNTTGRPAYDDRFTIQTSTGTLFAPTFSGNLSGNATTATTASYANKININGISNDTKYGTYGGIIQDSSTGPNSGAWHNTIKILHNNSTGYYTSIATQFTGDDGLWFRSYRNGVDQGWKRVAVQNMNNTFSGDNTFTGKLIWNDAYWTAPGNIVCTKNGTNAEFSFDMGAGTQWHVWSTPQGRSILSCWADNSYVQVPIHLYVGSYNNTSYALSTDSFICNSWVRTYGDCGWYNEKYGGGWYMTDSTYIRAYNGKMVYSSGRYLSETVPSSWLAGQNANNGAYNVNDYSNDSSYNPWMRAKNTHANVKKYFSFGTLGKQFYWIGSTTDRTENGFDKGMTFNVESGLLYAPIVGGDRVYTGYDSGETNSVSCSNWFRSNGDTGWYNASHGTHIRPNTVSTYGSIRIHGGAKGGYEGIHFGAGKNGMTVMSIDGSHQGLYNEAAGKWIIYYPGSGGSMGVGTSSLTSGYAVTQGSTSMTGILYMNNCTINGVNDLAFADPGAGEGISWAGGNGWQIYESPDNLSNGAGNLQFVHGSTRRLTINKDGYVDINCRLVVRGNGSSYNEGIRILPASNGWSNVFFSANTTLSDTHDGGWLIGRRGAAGTTGGVGDFTIEEQSSSGANLTIHKDSNGATLYGLMRTTQGFQVQRTSGDGYGLGLYGSSAHNSYGIHMSLTSGYSKHGFVQGDWATYFCFDGATNRGWIFKQAGTNVASISGTGGAKFDDTVFSYAYTRSNNKAAFMWDKPGSNYTGVGANGSSDTIQFRACDANGSWVDYKQKWAFYGKIEAAEYIYAATYLQAAAHIYVNTGSLNMLYNNTWYEPVKNHNNGNITLNAASGNLYIGYQTTNGIIMSSSNAYGTSLPTTNLTTGRIYYKLV